MNTIIDGIWPGYQLHIHPPCFGRTRSGDKPNVLRTAGGLYKVSAAESQERYL